MGMIDTSRSALLVFQRALDTTSHNIANVYTEGYSRQKVNLSALGSTNPSDSAAPGGGVSIGRIDRAFDQVLTDSVRYDSATYGRTETFAELTSSIDLLFAGSETGLSTQMQSYFSALQDVSNDPSSVASRQVLLGESDMLTARFRELNNRLDEISSISNSQLFQVVGEINSYGQQIAEVNLKIKDSGDTVPLDLLDARDHLINQLSERVSVSTVEAFDGTVSVFAGDGQALVVGSHAEALGVIQSDYQGNGFRVVLGSAQVDVTAQMSGGVIGGVLDFQSEVQRPAQNEIGRMAAVLASSFNELHREGYDLNGNTGKDFFNYSGPAVVSSTSNSVNSTVTASFVKTLDDAGTAGAPGTPGTESDIAQLKGDWQASDYELVADGAGGWTLTRLNDNTTVALTANANNNNSPPDPITSYTAADGFVVDVSAAAGAGANDRFLIRPFQEAAADISVAISNPRDFAAANAINPAYELEYVGTPAADSWKLTRLSDGQSTAVLGDNSQGIISDGFEIALPDVATLTPGQKYQINPFDSDPTASGLTVTVNDRAQVIRRNVLNMDDFNTESNPVGIRPGNNENVLAFANIQTDNLLGSGTISLDDAYNQLVASVGIKTNQAKTSMQAQGVMLEQSKLARDSVSGVNLDEEAADLIKFQQAYQAAAKVMAAADAMFKSLMNSLR